MREGTGARLSCTNKNEKKDKKRDLNANGYLSELHETNSVVESKLIISRDDKTLNLIEETEVSQQFDNAQLLGRRLDSRG